jgi:hypothetical protein
MYCLPRRPQRVYLRLPRLLLLHLPPLPRLLLRRLLPLLTFTTIDVLGYRRGDHCKTCNNERYGHPVLVRVLL